MSFSRYFRSIQRFTKELLPLKSFPRYMLACIDNLFIIFIIFIILWVFIQYDIRLIALLPAQWVSKGVSWWSSWGQRILSVCLWCCWGWLLAVCLHCRTVVLGFVRVVWWVRAIRRCRGWRFVGYGCTHGGFQPSFIQPWCPLTR